MAQRRFRAGAMAVALAIALLLALAAVALARREGSPPAARAPAERPKLMLVTTLPILFPEDFSLQGGGSKAIEAIETRYRVVPIGTTNAAELRQGKMLLMAHPLAQPAEALVDLDEWVKKGGRLLLLADPRLDWPSMRPLGDKLRPPPGFADTGLLAHWGLTLVPPGRPGPQKRRLGGQQVLASSPGSLAGSCDVAADGFVARCRIGRGRATVVADADFLNVDGLSGPKSHNLDALMTELERLER
jgi:hypothetical protein